MQSAVGELFSRASRSICMGSERKKEKEEERRREEKTLIIIIIYTVYAYYRERGLNYNYGSGD